MDVLNANKYAVNGRVYRRNVPLEAIQGGRLRTTAIERLSLLDVDDEYDSNPDFEETNVDNVGDEIIEQPTAKNKTNSMPAADHCKIVYDERKLAFMTETNFPTQLLHHLVGTKDRTKKNIENLTDAKINIVKQEDVVVEISSPLKESVERCYDRIKAIIVNGQKRLPYTHFVMFPALEPRIMDAHAKLVNSIRNCAYVDKSCKEPSIFVPSTKLHLTVIPLWLFGEKDMKAASVIVDEIVNDFSAKNPGPVDVHLKGLSNFKDEDLRSVKKIYAKVVNSPKAQTLADAIASKLVTAGYAQKPCGGSVKLHLTVFNTRYFITNDYKNRCANATGLLKQFGNVEYGNFVVSQVNICAMGKTDANTGGYPVIYSLTL